MGSAGRAGQRFLEEKAGWFLGHNQNNATANCKPIVPTIRVEIDSFVKVVLSVFLF